MERQRISEAINLILIGVVCGAFGALGTYAIYDIVPSEYFAQYQRFVIGAFISCGVVSTIVLTTSTQPKTDKAISNDQLDMEQEVRVLWVAGGIVHTFDFDTQKHVKMFEFARFS